MAIKAVGTLIKLQKSRVDEQRRVLAEAQKILDAIDHEITQLTLQSVREQEAARQDSEKASTYGAYVRWATDRSRLLDGARATAVAAVEREREVLSQLFEEQKRYEIVQENHELAEEKARNKQELAELDETAGMNFERKHRDKP